MPYQIVRVEQFPGLNGLLLVLVGVKRRNALFGGAVLFVLQPVLFQFVQSDMPGQHQRGTVADFQIFGRDGNALCCDTFDLSPKVCQIQSNTVTQNIDNALSENAGGKQMQGKLPVLIDDGVTGVAAALIPHDHIIILGEQVYHAALALIAPVDSNDCTVFHNLTSLVLIFCCSFLSNLSLSPRLGIVVG